VSIKNNLVSLSIY